MVLVLTGPSSAGKTTLATKIQRRSAIPFLHLEADRLVPTMPAHVHAAVIRDHGPETIALALHASMAAWARAGLNLVVDGPLPYGDPQLRTRCLAIFAEFDLRIVAVQCRPERLTRREQARGDRPSGWAAKQAVDIHDGLPSDAYVDTSEISPAQAAIDILTQLHLPAHR
jgi:chloramphenicol 3-O phosphotransferase